MDECAQPVHVCPRCSSVVLNTMRQPSHVREHTRMCCWWVAEVSKHRRHFTHIRPGVRIIRPFVHATLNLTPIAHILGQQDNDRCRALYWRQSRECFGTASAHQIPLAQDALHRSRFTGNATRAIIRGGHNVAPPRHSSSSDRTGRLQNDTPHRLGTNSCIGSQPRELEHMCGNDGLLHEERFLLHVSMPDGGGGYSL